MFLERRNKGSALITYYKQIIFLAVNIIQLDSYVCLLTGSGHRLGDGTDLVSGLVPGAMPLVGLLWLDQWFSLYMSGCKSLCVLP